MERTSYPLAIFVCERERERKKERESSSLDEVVREKRKRERKRALVCFRVWRKWKGKKRKE